MNKRSSLVIVALACLLLSLIPMTAYTFSNGQDATTVIGQPSFTSRTPVATQDGLDFPQSVAFDSSGNLWVADAQNSRVLEYSRGAGFTNGEPASLVIGQSSFTGNASATNQGGLADPESATFDSAGNLWVADSGNNRVLEFPKGAGFTSGEGASLVIGQSGFAASGESTTQNGLNFPQGIAFDSSGNLWVADGGNNRVLRFTPPFTSGELASVVIGQSDFTTRNYTGAQGSMLSPAGLAFDASGNLWVASSLDSRVLEFTFPFTNNESASVVIGQLSIEPTPSSLSVPWGIAFDSSGNLWVGDSLDGRVLQFLKGGGFTSGESAAVVIGKPDFVSGSPLAVSPTTPNFLRFPQGIAFDPSGNLWVADTRNSRVLEFAATGQSTVSGTTTTSSTTSSSSVTFVSAFSNGQNANGVIGQSSFASNAPATSQAGLSNPLGAAVDSAGNLWVADTLNNRVLEFPKGPGFTLGESASVVIGQSGFTTSNNATTQSGLAGPAGVAFDSHGNLWVVDDYHSRVLEFTPPFTSGELASVVIGQPNFTSTFTPSTNGGLTIPTAIAFDSSGNLWVADYEFFFTRILEFTPPFSNGESPSVTIGQVTLGFSGPQANQYSLLGPAGIAFDPAGNLWVADSGNNRVLEFPKGTGFTSGEGASVVIGQSSFATRFNATTQGNLDYPESVAFDPSGNLWVADALNNRVLEFGSPFVSGELASAVIGQSGFATGTKAATQNGLSLPVGVAFDSLGNLWVADSGNNRILEFSAPSTTTSSTTSASSSTTTSTAVMGSSTSSVSISTTSTSSLSMTSGSPTSTATTNSSSAGATSSTSSAGASGVPEFPSQTVAVAFALVIVTSYLAVRHRTQTAP